MKLGVARRIAQSAASTSTLNIVMQKNKKNYSQHTLQIYITNFLNKNLDPTNPEQYLSVQLYDPPQMKKTKYVRL